MTLCSVLFVMTSGVFGCATADDPRSSIQPELGRFFDDFDARGTFVLLEDDSGARTVYNAQRATEGFVPASTFKIMNSLVALETGVVAIDDTIRWDGVVRAVDSWNQDQRMRDAFQRSTVWFYQELARRIGAERMHEILVREGYGNEDSSGEIDQFWLTGNLRISAHEQVDFLRRLKHRDVGFPDKVVEEVEELLVMERCGGYTVRGKTGWERPRDVAHLGWLVGWIEKDSVVHYYAMNLESDDEDFPMTQARREITRGILLDLSILPSDCEEPA